MDTVVITPGGISTVAISITAGPAARNLDAGSSWARLRIGCRIGISADSGADITSAQLFFGMGLTAAGNRFKASQVGCAQFGLYSSGTFTRAIDASRPYYTAPSDIGSAVKSGFSGFIAGTGVHVASSVPLILMADGTLAALVIEITNDGSLYNFTYPIIGAKVVYPATIGSLTNITTEDFEAALKAPTMADVLSELGAGYAARETGTGANSLTMGNNPSEQPLFTSIESGWNKVSPGLLLDDVRVKLMA